MHYNELFVKLTYLTQQNNIKQTEIGEPIGLDKAAINKRAKNNSKFSDEEIEKIEEKFKVKLKEAVIVRSSLERQFDKNISGCRQDFGNRLSDIKKSNNLTELQLAGLLNLTENGLSQLITGKTPPDILILDNLKQNFKVSIDWLLYGS